MKYLSEKRLSNLKKKEKKEKVENVSFLRISVKILKIFMYYVRAAHGWLYVY